MGIQIINQTNEQECGVCVLTSLHNHYYKTKPVEKVKVLNQSHISSNGMSIFDFENTANQLGLECESYEVKWSEFVGLKLNKYFVLLLSIDNGLSNHYVIAKKHKRYLEIYDSCSNQMEKIKLSDIKNKFLNVIILINKKPNKLFNSIFKTPKTLLMLDVKFVIINIFLSLLILCVSILGATYLNYLIDLAIGKNSITNLLTISFIFIFIYFSNDLLTYISSLYTSGRLKTYLLLFTNKILYALQIKKLTFLNKVDKNWIFKVDECVYNISNFCILEINKLVTNIIFSVICFCVIGIYQPILLIFAVVIPLIQFIFFLFGYRKKKDIFIKIVRSENKNSSYYKQLIYSLGNELWENKRNNIIDKIKLNYSNLYKNFHDVSIYRNNTNLFRSLFKSLIEILLIGTIGILIIKNKNLTIGSLTFLISTFSLYKNSTNDIFNYFLARIEFDVYWQVYKDLTEVDNLDNQEKLVVNNEINQLTINTIDTNICLLRKQDNVLQTPVIENISNAVSIYTDEQKVDINNIKSLNQLIICDENSQIDTDYFLKLFESNPEFYSSYIRYFQINLNNPNMSFQTKNILNLLCLINEKDKVIIIDSFLDFFPPKDKMVVKEIINKIQKNNNLFIIRKEKYD